MELQKFNFQALEMVDISPFIQNGTQEQKRQTAQLIRKICTQSGFFYLKGHGVDQKLQQDIINASAEFFRKPKNEKEQIHMKKGGKAWRGYFSTGEELTSGKIDYKEGIYFGQELDNDNPEVKKGTHLHGRSLFPSSPQNLKALVLKWITVMQELGQKLMQAIAMSLRLQPSYFKQGICKDPLCLFRIFSYHKGPQNQESWGVGQHTDYGLLTILMYTTPGLQIKNRQNKWIKANLIENTFVINIGDMLQRMTRGLYRSTPHRVRMQSDCQRYSFPFFFDPGWNQKIEELKVEVSEEEKVLIQQQALQQRWDNQRLNQMKGTYGDYLTTKVSLVFPDLAKGNLQKGVMM